MVNPPALWLIHLLYLFIFVIHPPIQSPMEASAVLPLTYNPPPGATPIACVWYSHYLTVCLTGWKIFLRRKKIRFFFVSQRKTESERLFNRLSLQIRFGTFLFPLSFPPGVVFAAKQFVCMLSERDYQTVSPAQGHLETWNLVDCGTWCVNSYWI